MKNGLTTNVNGFSRICRMFAIFIHGSSLTEYFSLKSEIFADAHGCPDCVQIMHDLIYFHGSHKILTIGWVFVDVQRLSLISIIVVDHLIFSHIVWMLVNFLFCTFLYVYVSRSTIGYHSIIY